MNSCPGSVCDPSRYYLCLTEERTEGKGVESFSVDTRVLTGRLQFCPLTYIMQRERCLVDSRTDQSIDPKFVNVVHHLVFDSREDEINLKRF